MKRRGKSTVRVPHGQLESNMAELKGAYHQVDGRLGDLRAAFSDLRSDFSDLRSDFSDLRSETRDGFLRLDRKIDSRFLWMIGLNMTSWVTVMLAIVFKH